MNRIKSFPLYLFILLVIFSCSQDKQDAEKSLSLDYEKYTLENGLDVILHKDASDPIVSVAILYHVGSNREKPQRTGFAHLFEHMLFQQSEHVAQDEFIKIVEDAGGEVNGGTWDDGTIYYEVVPKSALERILWLESDRMGFFKNTITQSAFANQQNIVVNEKRQRVDNTPYGHTDYVIQKAIFPEDHPYNWQVIGEMEDLKNATVDDVRDFYDNFYGPNNATLVIAGDYNDDSVKVLVEKYFGEIKRGNETEPLKVRNVTLNETKKLYHEDNFAQVPQMNMVWPTVEQFNDDSYALDFLAEILSDGKKAPLYEVLVKEKGLTSETNAYTDSKEVAGMFRINISANQGFGLDTIEKSVFEAFDKFEKDTLTDKDIERVKASLETQFYNQLQSILSKSFQLAYYSVFTGDPSFIEKDIEKIRAVTKEDVLRVYNTYIKDKPYVVTSFVPQGQLDKIVAGSEKADVVEEKVDEQGGQAVAEATPGDEKIEETPSTFDRSVKPAEQELPGLNIPEVWTTKLDNGLKVYGIENDELPLVNFNIVIDGGHLYDDMDKPGVANLMTDIMMEGTATKTPEELEEEIDLLGSSISMYTSEESITIQGSSLVRNFEKTLDLVEELLLEPRWDSTEFERIKIKTIQQIQMQRANPVSIASKTFKKLIYGKDHIFAYPISGTETSVQEITIEDLKDFYNKNFSPSVSRMHIVGKINQQEVVAALQDLNKKWEAKNVAVPHIPEPVQIEQSELYFVDFPGAKQSVIFIGNPSMARTSPDFYPAEVMNYMLGGSFYGVLNYILREEKGYTYGAGSFFTGSKLPGYFMARSSVQTAYSKESVQIFIDEMKNYREGIDEEALEMTKNSLIKSNTRRFETLESKLDMLTEMSKYDLKPDFVKNEEDIIRNMTIERHKELAQKYIQPEKMIYVIVGDAATQFEAVKSIGFDAVQQVVPDSESEEKEVDMTALN